MKRRIVLAGFGAVAQGLSADARMARWFPKATHAQILADHPRLDWIGVIDPRPEAAQAAKAWGVPCWPAPPRGLAADLAVLAMPPEGRLKLLAALGPLKGLMVEKPLGMDLRQAKSFAAACRRRRLPAQVALWRRGDAGSAGLKGRIGAIQGGAGIYGNGLRNNGVHLIDFVRLVAGEIAAVRALGPARPAAGAPLSGDVALAGALELASGAQIALLPVDFAHYREVGLDLWGTTGRLAVMQEGLSVRRFPVVPNRGLEGAAEIASDAPEDLPVTVGAALGRLYDDWLDHLDDPVVPLASPIDQALVAEAAVDALLRSAARGGPRITLG